MTKAHDIKLISKALSVSTLNQAVSSMTNFLFGLYLVRILSPIDFGLYGICFAICLFYGGAGNALFLLQMVVNMPNKKRNERSNYAWRIFTILLTFCVTTSLLVVAAMKSVPIIFGQQAYLVYAVTATSTTYLLKEFFIRHAYNVRKEIHALAIHCILAATLAGFISVCFLNSILIDVETAIWGYAFAHFCAICIGCFISDLPIRMPVLSMLKTDILECWHGGQWAFSTNIVYFLRTQAHTIVVASTVGPVGVAQLNAARLLVTPAVMLTPALGQVFIPRLAKARAKNSSKIFTMACALTGVLLTIALLYSIILMCSLSYISPLLLGDQYATSTYWLVAGWCLVTCLLALRNGAEMTAQALKHFRQLTIVNTISALTTLLSVYLFLAWLGTGGALIGLAVGECSLIILVWLILIRCNISTSLSNSQCKKQ